MVAIDVADEDRTSYDLIEERRFPPFVLEVVSPTRSQRDGEEKVRAYDLLGAEEYVVFTPYLDKPSRLEGWQRGESGRFGAWPLNEAGELRSLSAERLSEGGGAAHHGGDSGS